MNPPLTIVTYHYVRELEHSRYPSIKGRSLEDFAGQLDYLQRYYRFVTLTDCAAALYESRPLPTRAALLTFDDGYADHFINVFPQLEARGIQGCFFPTVRATLEDRVLDVNKIQFVLASAPAVDVLLSRVFSLLDSFREEYGLASKEVYFERFAVASRWDTREVRFLKNLLQHGLPREVRERILAILFREYLAEDEACFARELYMSAEQLRYLRQHGMHVGSHGYDHVRINTLSPQEQHKEMKRSAEFLASLGVGGEEWTLCYPYGAYDESAMDAARKAGFRLAFSARVGLAHLTDAEAFRLKRLDTNDLPVDAGAPPNPWTRRASD